MFVHCLHICDRYIPVHAVGRTFRRRVFRTVLHWEKSSAVPAAPRSSRACSWNVTRAKRRTLVGQSWARWGTDWETATAVSCCSQQLRRSRVTAAFQWHVAVTSSRHCCHVRASAAVFLTLFTRIHQNNVTWWRHKGAIRNWFAVKGCKRTIELQISKTHSVHFMELSLFDGLRSGCTNLS